MTFNLRYVAKSPQLERYRDLNEDSDESGSNKTVRVEETIEKNHIIENNTDKIEQNENNAD